MVTILEYRVFRMLAIVFLLYFMRVVAHECINPVSSWHLSTCSITVLLVLNIPIFCPGLQAFTGDGCCANICQRRHGYKVDKYGIATERSGISRSLFDVPIELSVFNNTWLTTNSFGGRMIQVEHIRHGFVKLDPESIFAGIDPAARSTGSTFNTFSASRVPSAFVSLCVGHNKLGLLSDALHSNGATTNCPIELLLADHH